MAPSTSVCNESDPGRDCDAGLPVDPFTALKPHFGMLLGVADFQTIDAYHRGKQWLHNAWLHRQGVVWGFEVSVDTERGEIRVSPGLAVDGLGRELFLPRPLCLNLAAWLEKHAEDDGVIEAIRELSNGRIRLDAHVVVRFRACLARQVPALMDACEGAGSSTAYSRVMESVEVLLKPDTAAAVGSETRALPYHRLRLLFGLENPISRDGAVIDADREVIDERNAILVLPNGEQPRAWLDALRRFAAEDAVAMGPQVSPSGDTMSQAPLAEPAELVLANLTDLTLKDATVQSGDADNTVRDTLIATSTIQELLCGPPVNTVPGELPDAPTEAEDAGGPRIDTDSVVLEEGELLMDHEGPRLLANSLTADVSVFVALYDANTGWVNLGIGDIVYDRDQKRISVPLPGAPAAGLFRVLVKGSGLTPVLGRRGQQRIPLAGAIGGDAGGPVEGNDFIHMFTQEA